MESMRNYTQYCTEEQTHIAFKLGAPLDKFDPDNSNGVICDDVLVAIPTTQQVIGWLENIHNIRIYPKPNLTPKGFEYLAYYYDDVNEYIVMNGYQQGFNTRHEAELAAISTVLNRLKISQDS